MTFEDAIKNVIGMVAEDRLRTHLGVIHSLTVLAREPLFIGPPELKVLQFCNESIHLLAGASLAYLRGTLPNPETERLLLALRKQAMELEIGEEFERAVSRVVTLQVPP
jgi:hypothetical protein